MGPAVETFLTAFVPVVLAIALIGYLGRAQFKELGNYIRVWRARDEVLDKQEQEDQDCRERAESELKDLLGEQERQEGRNKA